MESLESAFCSVARGISRRSLSRNPTKDNELARLPNTAVFLCMKKMVWVLANA